jgi:hypothetical protein
MRSTLRAAGFVILLLIAGGGQVSAQAAVAGDVRNHGGAPIPGLTASLVHPIVGRSAPSFTDPLGRYVFYNVPFRPDPYYLEIYWGNQLMYRSIIYVGNPVVALGTIVL